MVHLHCRVRVIPPERGASRWRPPYEIRNYTTVQPRDEALVCRNVHSAAPTKPSLILRLVTRLGGLVVREPPAESGSADNPACRGRRERALGPAARSRFGRQRHVHPGAFAPTPRPDRRR